MQNLQVEPIALPGSGLCAYFKGKCVGKWYCERHELGLPINLAESLHALCAGQVNVDFQVA